MATAYEFKIIEEAVKEKFTKEVNEMLNSGWELHGDLKVFPEAKMFNGEVIHYVQAFKKSTSSGQKSWVGETII